MLEMIDHMPRGRGSKPGEEHIAPYKGLGGGQEVLRDVHFAGRGPEKHFLYHLRVISTRTAILN
eukprot:COSAG01_NODE_4408_length_5059_cov_2.693565_11_plen_64_part_00